jgi:hypothetical protein
LVQATTAADKWSSLEVLVRWDALEADVLTMFEEAATVAQMAQVREGPRLAG